MHDLINIGCTAEELSVLMALMRNGIKHLMGEEAFMKVLESKRGDRVSEDVRLSSMYTLETTKAQALYSRIEEIAEKSHRDSPLVKNYVDKVTVIERETVPVESYIDQVTTIEREEVSSETFVDVVVRQTEATGRVPAFLLPLIPLVAIGHKVKYTGEKCALRPGLVYRVLDTSYQDDVVFLKINNGYYRSIDFDLALQIAVGDCVEYTGYDGGVGHERRFSVIDIKSWGGTPYVSIRTLADAHLSYPLDDFRLLEDGVDDWS
jgi:hypothetical protein